VIEEYDPELLNLLLLSGLHDSHCFLGGRFWFLSEIILDWLLDISGGRLVVSELTFSLEGWIFQSHPLISKRKERCCSLTWSPLASDEIYHACIRKPS
jgi:hypothetical protein